MTDHRLIEAFPQIWAYFNMITTYGHMLGHYNDMGKVKVLFMLHFAGVNTSHQHWPCMMAWFVSLITGPTEAWQFVQPSELPG